MWRRKGKKEEDGALSEGDEPPRKTLKTTDNDSDDSDQIFICNLSKNRKVSVRYWQGKIAVDIREFYVKDGKELPGKKGISLTMDQWKKLREHTDEIEKGIGENN